MIQKQTKAAMARHGRSGRPRELEAVERITIYLEAALKQRIDAARGETPRAAWMREAMEQRLSRDAPNAD